MDKKPIMTIIIGLPRSGKSTYVSDNKEDAVILSADELRMLIYGQRYFQGGESYVWAVRDTMLKYLIQQRKDIVIDDTNTMVSRRSPVIKLAKNAGYEIKAVYVKTDMDECIKRAYATGQDDLVPSISRMNSQLEEPTYAEGFDSIKVVGEDINA